MGGRLCAATLNSNLPGEALFLKAVPHANFGRKCMRECHSARRDKIERFFERSCLTWAEITAEVVAKVGAIRQIKELDERGDVVTLLDPEVLRDADVKLEERLTSKIIKGSKNTCAASQAVSEL